MHFFLNGLRVWVKSNNEYPMRAAVGAIAIGAAVVASAPVSLPLIAAGAVVGAGVAFDASVISDWKKKGI